VALKQVIYSASVLEVATTLCFVDFHEIALLCNRKTYLEVDL